MAVNMPAKDLGLWEQYRMNKDGQARESLILSYLPLVKYITGRIAISLPPFVQRDDLVGYGVFGLIDAIEKFDSERGIKFDTYAYTRIRGAILDGLRSMDWFPPALRQKARELERTYTRLEQELGRSATDDEVAGALSMGLNEFHQLLLEAGGLSLQSLDEPLVQSENKGSTLVDQLSDQRLPGPTENLEKEEEKQILAGVLNKLPEKEKLVVTLYYYEELTLKEIGEVLGLSESRISQLHTKAVLRLRGHLSRIKKKVGW